MGIPVLPPDINESDFNFTVGGGAVRFGLAAVKNVAETTVREILRERSKRGRFRTPFDVVGGTDPRTFNKKVLESLIKAGAFDSLGWRRSGCFHLIDSMIQYAHELNKLTSHSRGQLDEEKDFNNEIRVAGIIGTVKPLKTRKDERFATFVLEDLTGRIDVRAYPESS